MGGILDHRHICRIAQGHDRIHVRRVAAHMADNNCLTPGQLGSKVVDIDPVIVAYFAQHWQTVGMNDRRRNRRKSEPRDQNPCITRQVQRLERQEQRR